MRGPEGHLIRDPASRFSVAFVTARGDRGVVTNLFDGNGEETYDLGRARAAVVYVEQLMPRPWVSIPLNRSDLAGLYGTA